MSDLLSPILFVMKNESESFWCFVSLMERLGPNFNRDQNGMHSQLFALMKVLSLSLSVCLRVGGVFLLLLPLFAISYCDQISSLLLVSSFNIKFWFPIHCKQL